MSPREEDQRLQVTRQCIERQPRLRGSPSHRRSGARFDSSTQEVLYFSFPAQTQQTVNSENDNKQSLLERTPQCTPPTFVGMQQPREAMQRSLRTAKRVAASPLEQTSGKRARRRPTPSAKHVGGAPHSAVGTSISKVRTFLSTLVTTCHPLAAPHVYACTPHKLLCRTTKMTITAVPHTHAACSDTQRW